MHFFFIFIEILGMKLLFRIVLFLFYFSSVNAQEGFLFIENKSKVSIPFKLINNLIIMPIRVNGVEMSFLLDTGVDETILFSLEDNEQVELFNVEKIKLRGLGSQEAIEGLKSTGNSLTIPGLINKNQTIIVVLDESFNFSSSLGIPVNGIIGYHFFKNNLVEINYVKKKIIVHNDKKFDSKKLKKFEKFDINIEKSKPYINTEVLVDNQITSAKLLIDTGNSDAIWIFQDIKNGIKVPAKNFEDFLGRGFSGDIFGKRARIQKFSIKNFAFYNPLITFPDSNSIKNVRMVDDRVGSIGGEICKRFTVYFDYKNEKIFLKKNGNYNNPFNFNMSGIVLYHSGVKLVQEENTNIKTKSTLSGVKIDFGEKEVSLKYKFELKPVYEVSNIRKDSPGEQAGLKKGDIITIINGSNSYRYSLQEINDILKSEDGKTIEIEVERNKKLIKFKFKLKNLL